MSRESKITQSMLHAYEIGYRVGGDGVLIGPRGEFLDGYLSNNGYLRKSLYMDGKSSAFMIHRLAAYQKFGEKLFGTGMVVRHLDSDPTNNRPENIGIGTMRDNAGDIPPERKLTRGRRRIPKELIQNIVADRDAGIKTKQVCEKYDVQPKFVHRVYFWYKCRTNGRSLRS